VVVVLKELEDAPEITYNRKNNKILNKRCILNIHARMIISWMYVLEASLGCTDRSVDELGTVLLRRCRGVYETCRPWYAN
jgi:hypothetical protein